MVEIARALYRKPRVLTLDEPTSSLSAHETSTLTALLGRLRTSILGGSGTYAGTIPGAILLVTITALITVVNASSGWRNILFGSLVLGLLLLSGREAVRR
jgi:predicted ABC-type sugar transport system permease subunit